ncbi:MAG TPA: class I SAM-dependent methyltransferase [Thermoleophilaceae bacterium]
MDFIDPRIDRYAAEHTTPPDELLAGVAAATQKLMPIPRMMSGLVEARLLEALIVISGATRVLEVGTFTGFGALAMAAALPEDGELVTLERKEENLAVAREYIERSPHASKIKLVVGDAREELEKLEGPFDIVFIDAWKKDYVTYYERSLAMLSERGLIVADNVLWSGRVIDDSSEEGETLAVRTFNDHIQADPRVHNVILSVGDGLLLAWRRLG